VVLEKGMREEEHACAGGEEGVLEELTIKKEGRNDGLQWLSLISHFTSHSESGQDCKSRSQSISI
jgi:hypothetical protein